MLVWVLSSFFFEWELGGGGGGGAFFFPQNPVLKGVFIFFIFFCF